MAEHATFRFRMVKVAEHRYEVRMTEWQGQRKLGPEEAVAECRQRYWAEHIARALNNEAEQRMGEQST